MATPTPRVTARLLIERYPDIGAAVSDTLDSAEILPMVFPGGSGTASTWNNFKSETRKIASGDTGVTFPMDGDPVLIAIAADGPFVIRMATGETDLLVSDILLGGDGAPIKTGALAFEIDGNGDTPVNVSVLMLSKS